MRDRLVQRKFEISKEKLLFDEVIQIYHINWTYSMVNRIEIDRNQLSNIVEKWLHGGHKLTISSSLQQTQSMETTT